jgi:hypothetical protein
MGRDGVNRLLLKEYTPRSYGVDSGDRLKHGTLSCAVGTDQGDDLSGRDVQGDPLEGMDMTVIEVKVSDS